MQKSLSPRGGRSVFQQWIHIHSVRVQWLEIGAKDIFLKYTVLARDIPGDKKALIKALEDSTEGISLLLSRSWTMVEKSKHLRKESSHYLVISFTRITSPWQHTAYP